MVYSYLYRVATYRRTRLKPAVAATLFLLMLGCTKTPHEQPYTTISTPSALPAGPVALIISDSTTETIREMTRYHNHFKNSWTAQLYTRAIRQAYVETSDPNLSLAGVTQRLEKRFTEVQVYPSLKEASHSGFPLIAKLDTAIRLINNRSSEPASHLALDFYTPDGRYLGTVESTRYRTLTPLWAKSKREDEIVADIRQQGEVQQEALALLEQRLNSIPTE